MDTSSWSETRKEGIIWDGKIILKWILQNARMWTVHQAQLTVHWWALVSTVIHLWFHKRREYTDCLGKYPLVSTQLVWPTADCNRSSHFTPVFCAPCSQYCYYYHSKVIQLTWTELRHSYLFKITYYTPVGAHSTLNPADTTSNFHTVNTFIIVDLRYLMPYL